MLASQTKRLGSHRLRRGKGKTSQPRHTEDADGLRSGFTMIEVMLVLGLTGLLLLGVLGGTFSSISSQRYNDSVRSFAEYLRKAYSEVISPESLGDGNSDNYAVLGKVLFFGSDSHNVYSATLVGDVKAPDASNGSFMEELAKANARLYCGDPSAASDKDKLTTAAKYTLPWEAELKKTKPNLAQNFTGTVIIARSPYSGTIHTMYAEHNYWPTNDLDGCNPANNTLNSTLQKIRDNQLSSIPDSQKFNPKQLGICVKSNNASLFREIRIVANGRNTSAVSVLDIDAHGGKDGSSCQ